MATITALTPDRAEEAVRMLAGAFATNPQHVAVFGADRVRANEAFFRIGVASLRGVKLVACEGASLLGLIHWVGSPGCRFSPGERLRVLPRLVRGVGLSSALKVASWLSVWLRHDPEEPHSHLGPVGVATGAQGRGIGSLLMERYCEDLGRTGLAGYLETDRPENVAFYRKFGFEVVGTASNQGVRNYFMERKACRS